MKELLDFLIRAKKSTYANDNAATTNALRLNSKDYHYEENIAGKKICYHDTYFGGEKFIGEEVVYIENKAVWAMNYNGYTLISNLNEEVIKLALRPALMLVGNDKSVLPLRGPSEFKNGDYTYTFSATGTIENFIGVEKIFKNNHLVYTLNCSGGIIK